MIPWIKRSNCYKERKAGFFFEEEASQQLILHFCFFQEQKYLKEHSSEHCNKKVFGFLFVFHFRLFCFKMQLQHINS